MNVNYGPLDLSRWILMDIRCLSISMYAGHQREGNLRAPGVSPDGFGAGGKASE